MRDDLLSTAAAFDWISPLVAIIRNVTSGPSYTFLIPSDSGRSGNEVSSLLKQRGIQSWGHMVVRGTFMLTVRQGHAAWAQRTLDHAGIPVDNPVVAAASATTRNNKPRKRGHQAESPTKSKARELWELRLF